MQRFTATGRPMAAFEQSTLQSWGGDMYTVPQFLPKQYTDDSIIPAILTGVLPSPPKPAATADGEDAAAGLTPAAAGGASGEAASGSGKRRKSFAKIFSSSSKSGGSDSKNGKGITKVVFMPRREYIKYFAKDNNGNYCGTEPYRQWTEGELDEKYGEYRPKELGKKRRAVGNSLWVGG